MEVTSSTTLVHCLKAFKHPQVELQFICVICVSETKMWFCRLPVNIDENQALRNGRLLIFNKLYLSAAGNDSTREQMTRWELHISIRLGTHVNSFSEVSEKGLIFLTYSL